MPKITPHLWYDTQAVEAAGFYADTFPSSKVLNVSTIRDTPSGDTDIVSFELFGQRFQAISAGPFFSFNPSISFLVRCSGASEVDEYWRALSDGGSALMPLDAYPFSKRYGWTADRYGLSWQIMLTEDDDGQRIVPTLMFVGDVAGRARGAIERYTSLFPNSKVDQVLEWGAGEAPEREGTIKHAGFALDGYRLAAMDSAGPHDFAFNEAISLMITCDTQAEIDRYWEGLSAVPEAEQCGWLKDEFGVSWQVTPSAMDEMLSNGSTEQIACVTQAFLQMKKFDIAELQRAYDA